MTELIDILPQHRFDEAGFGTYLAAQLPEVQLPLVIRQFQGGQSNPTFLVEDAAQHRYVLRKKPPGQLLPSAHAVDREFMAMRALHPLGVPVPRARVLCEDDSIIGTAFYVMDHVEGVVHTDLTLADVPRDQRAGYYHAMADGLAALHRVDWRAAGLEGYGRPEAYISRQISRWTKQYIAANPEPTPAMDNLIAWLPENQPPEAEARIAHGDFRLGNLMFAAGAPRLLAILDWELATIGDPLADLAYLCSFYRLPSGHATFRGMAGLDLAGLGIPSEAEMVERYCAAAGCAHPGRHWAFYLAFSLFRSASIGQGVYDRARRGNAADRRAIHYQDMMRGCAEIGWSIAQGA